MERQKVSKVWIDDAHVYAETEKGLVANYPFAMWKHLAHGTKQQLEDFYLSYTGVHWPQLDEDLSFEGMFAYSGLGNRTETEDSFYWEA